MSTRGEPATDPCRLIWVHFGDSKSDLEHMMMYSLTKSRILDTDESSRTVQVVHTLPQEEPDRAAFENWVAQSVQQTAKKVAERISAHVAISEYFNASLLTRSPFTFDVLASQGNRHRADNPRSFVADLLMKFDLPFVTGISSETLMSVRHNEGEAFNMFRTELERRLLTLRNESDESKLESHYSQMMYELTEINSSVLAMKLPS